MSLKAFHLCFITLSALLGVGLILWGFQNYLQLGEEGNTGLGITGFVLFIFLIPYMRWFQRKMKKLTVVFLGLVLSTPDPLWACAVCFGNPSDPMVKGAKMGVLALGGIVYLLLLGMISIAFSWGRRAKKLAHHKS